MTRNYLIDVKHRPPFRFSYPLAALVLWRCIFCTSTLVSRYTVGLQILFFFIWLLLKSAEDGAYLNELLLKGKFLIVFIIIIAAFDFIIADSLTAQTRTFALLFMEYSIMLAYRKGHQPFVKVLLVLLMADYCYTVFIYYRLLAVDPLYARTFSSGYHEGVAGLGGYIFIYATTLLFSFLIGISANKSICKKPPLLFIFLCIVQFVLILRALYYIAIITAVVCTIYALLPMRPKTKIALSLSLIFAMLVLKEPLSGLIFNLAHSVSNEFTAVKLLEISKYLAADSLSAFAPTSRVGLVLTSIKAFFDHPLLGVYNFETNAQYIRGHSGIFDLISDYGIIRLTPMIIFLVSAFRELVQNAPPLTRDAMRLSMFAFVFVGIFDPVFSSQILMVIFVVIPFLSEYIDYTMVSTPTVLTTTTMNGDADDVL